MSRHHPRVYPLSFNSDGCLVHVQEVERCVRASRNVLGLKSENGVLLLCEQEHPNSLNHITKVSANIIAAGSGLPGDILVLLHKCQLMVDTYRLKFQQDMPLDELAQELSSLMSYSTMLKTIRPYQASIILAGWDRRGYHLFLVNPSGELSSWAAVAVGRKALSCQQALERESGRVMSMSLQTAKKLGVKTFLTTMSEDMDCLQMVWLKNVDKKIEVLTATKEEIAAFYHSND